MSQRTWRAQIQFSPLSGHRQWDTLERAWLAQLRKVQSPSSQIMRVSYLRNAEALTPKERSQPIIYYRQMKSSKEDR